MNNYERQCEQWRLRFLDMDQAELCRRLPEVTMEAERLTLWHFGRQFAVDRTTGEIRVLSDSRPVDVTPRLNIYTLFGYAAPGAHLTGEWVPFRELRDGAPFAPAFQNGVLTPLAATFSGQEPRLAAAAEALRGRRTAPAAFLLPAFRCIPIKMLFWDGDEDFPAQANLLFDRSATDFIHVESIVTIAAEALHQLSEAAELPIQGSPFVRY